MNYIQNAATDANKLIKQIADNNDKAAFMELYKLFAPRLRSFMLGKGVDEFAADELVQETLLSVWRKGASFDPEKASASTWIFTIARNLRIDRFRSENRPQPDPNDPALVREPEVPADEKIEKKQQADAVRKYIQMLPQDQSEVVHLAFMESLSHQQISDRLQIPLGTVKSRLRLSFSKLKTMMRNMP